MIGNSRLTQSNLSLRRTAIATVLAAAVAAGTFAYYDFASNRLQAMADNRLAVPAGADRGDRPARLYLGASCAARAHPTAHTCSVPPLPRGA